MDFFLQIKDDKLEFIENTGKKLTGSDGETVYYFGTILNPDSILESFINNRKNQTSLTQGIHGNFSVICIEKNGYAYIFQDIMGGNRTIYYTVHENRVYLATSIKYFKKISLKYKFNTSVADEFIYNGVIKTRDTLLCGVYKLLPGEYIKIVSGIPSVLSDFPELKNQSVPEIDDLYKQETAIIKEYVRELKQWSRTVNATLSGGYDSNLILHTINQEGYKASVYSCGGVRGGDETHIAQKISDYYDGVELEKEYVDENVLRYMKDIVWRLEGALYERGIFLQYILARNLYDHNVKCVMLGECADQVFNKNFYSNDNPEFIMTYITHPYELGSLVVLKKSTSMLASFGIQGLYPFIDDRMICLGNRTKENNSITKEYQKKMCRAYINPTILEYIDKKPGSTSLCTLFANREEEEKFMEDVRNNNEFYRPDFRIVYRYEKHESELDYYLCLEYLKCFKEVFCEL